MHFTYFLNQILIYKKVPSQIQLDYKRLKLLLSEISLSQRFDLLLARSTISVNKANPLRIARGNVAAVLRTLCTGTGYLVVQGRVCSGPTPW